MISIICVGKLKDKNLSNLSDQYEKWIRPYHKIELIEVKDFATNNKIDSKQLEGNLILNKIKAQDYVIVLDLLGSDISSEDLSNKIDKLFITYPNIVFVIGGSLGLSDEVIKRANFRWKLSSLTFTHQFVRIILLEQIYRSFKILANEPYHK